MCLECTSLLSLSIIIARLEPLTNKSSSAEVYSSIPRLFQPWLNVKEYPKYILLVPPADSDPRHYYSYCHGNGHRSLPYLS
ncbi:hypothetical protein BDW60DRAFT_28526 [Aspergillus nidulans var. acristatus]